MAMRWCWNVCIIFGLDLGEPLDMYCNLPHSTSGSISCSLTIGRSFKQEVDGSDGGFNREGRWFEHAQHNMALALGAQSDLFPT
ncbi:hypothetical protein BD779DRAFT_1507638 [Infundibulicybe gibba]|nr:hypothetical protein BD779DRAFT_1507638 [Infundibulicybe gibba]